MLRGTPQVAGYVLHQMAAYRTMIVYAGCTRNIRTVPLVFDGHKGYTHSRRRIGAWYLLASRLHHASAQQTTPRKKESRQEDDSEISPVRNHLTVHCPLCALDLIDLIGSWPLRPPSSTTFPPSHCDADPHTRSHTSVAYKYPTPSSSRNSSVIFLNHRITLSQPVLWKSSPLIAPILNHISTLRLDHSHHYHFEPRQSNVASRLSSVRVHTATVNSSSSPQKKQNGPKRYAQCLIDPPPPAY